MVLPVVFLVVALLAQPACLAYTHVLMQGAAAEGARVLATGGEGAADLARDYVMRRLAGVPEVPLFHVGGSNDWQVEVGDLDEGKVTVDIVGHARPLPLARAVAAALGATDSRGVALRAHVEEDVRSGWVGGSYGDWVGIWG